MTVREQHRRHRALARFWAGLGALAVLALLAPPLVAALLPTISPWHSSTVVASGSMEPAVRTGDIVVTRSVPDGTRVNASSVLLHRPPGEEHLRLHRVSQVDRDGRYLTRGDANHTDDGTPVPADRVIGVGALVVPAVGTPLLWVDEGRWGALLLLVIGAITIVRGARAGWRTDGAATLAATEEAPTPGHRSRRWRVATPALAATALVALALDPVGVVGRSSAAFTAEVNTDQNLVQAGIWAPLALTLEDPGPRLSGETSFTVDATGGQPDSTVTLQIQPHAGGDWSELCSTSAGPPYTCTGDTDAYPTGGYRLRAVAPDRGGLTAISDEVETTLHLPVFGGLGPAGVRSTNGSTATYPEGTLPGDVVLLVQISSTNTAITTPAGWTQLADVNDAFRFTVWWKRAGTETSVEVPGINVNNAGVALRASRYAVPLGRDPVALLHAGPANGTAAASASVTPVPTLSTTDAATVVQLAATRSDSVLTLPSPAGFELRATGSSTQGGQASTFGVADRQIPTGGPIPSPTWEQTGSAAWAWTTVAFR